MTKDTYKVSTKVVRLWKHECERVFRDRLVNQTDLDKYDEFLIATLKNWFKEEPLDQVQAVPNLFTSFIDATADDTPLYNQVLHPPVPTSVDIMYTQLQWQYCATKTDQDSQKEFSQTP